MKPVAGLSSVSVRKIESRGYTRRCLRRLGLHTQVDEGKTYEDEGSIHSFKPLFLMFTVDDFRDVDPYVPSL